MSSLKNQFLVRRTILEMLTDRGYNVDQYKLSDYQTFCKDFTNCLKDTNILRIIAYKKETKEPILVHFSDEEKMSLKNLKYFLENTISQNIRNIIIVLKIGISHSANKFAQECENLEICTFKEEDLLFNRTKHELVPKHRIISVEEKENLMKEKMLTEESMPKILSTDPIAKYLGARKGDVIEILRPSETVGITKFWRITIHE